MTGSKKSRLSRFLNSRKSIPVMAALAAGIYPLLFYYTNNYRMINSWQHFLYFTGVFLAAPVAVFVLADGISRFSFLKTLRPYLLPFLNLFFFFFYLSIALYAGIDLRRSAFVFLMAAGLTFLIKRFFKQWVLLQLILAGIGLVSLIPVLVSQLNYSEAWKQQPDAIEKAVFKKKPNIYFIQPDGYLNFSELKKGYYSFDNSEFENFLTERKFKSYPGFRSNYAATLPSNSAMFMMKHHYYNEGSDFTEIIDAREVIVSDNSFLRILKNNGYNTFLLSEQPYFLTNKPELGYDFSNFSIDEVDFFTTGIGEPRNIFPVLKEQVLHSEGPDFFFVQIFRPGHIATRARDSKGVEQEKEKYRSRLQESNSKLQEILDFILEKDPEALIVIVADHGGFVGFHHTEETETKTTDRDLLHSVFSTILSVHWPENEIPEFDTQLKSSVNLFRILTAYLSEDISYLSHLQDDSSYLIIKKGAPKGIYQCLDENGEVVFKKYRLE